MSRILVTGSRNWVDGLVIERDLLKLWYSGELVVVHGACSSGADDLASQICKSYGIDEEPHPADWKRHGKAAGFIRNELMVSLGADACYAYCRNGSHGTTMCAQLAAEAGIPVHWRRQ